MENTIDLRKTPELPPPPKELLPPDDEYSRLESEAFLMWVAPEYEAVVYSRNWFIGVGAVEVVLILIAIITRNYFFLVFVALSFFVVLMFTKRTPRELTFAIAKEGVYVGRKVLAWGTLKSFWVFEKNNQKELSLETDKTLTPLVRIPIRGVGTEELREVMKKFIPEKEHQELLADEIGRSLGF